jgi:hypothetical protein
MAVTRRRIVMELKTGTSEPIIACQVPHSLPFSLHSLFIHIHTYMHVTSIYSTYLSMYITLYRALPLENFT